MPVMKQLRIGSATYDTVGEASVTQVQTSGTKIATVTIDGTSTDLYAPEGGGSGPEPSSTTPAMDGTAAVGTATTYARADHVHPTDTSRQATLVSGTNIKTVNGNSLLGSGDLTVGGSVSMEDTAVDAAVEAAWPAIYTIENTYSYCRSITLDGSYGSDVTVLETEAMANAVVTFSYAVGMTLVVTDANGGEVPSTYVDTYMTGGSSGPEPEPPMAYSVYSFVMPDSNVAFTL